LREIVEAALAVGERGKACVLATVVKVEGSAYRRPGARMIFPEDAAPLGMVSGGCLEADLAERAKQVLASGRAATVVYDMRSPDDIVWGLGLGCNGEVRVLLERLDAGGPPEWLRFVDRRLRERKAGVLVTSFSGPSAGERFWLGEEGLSGGSLDALATAARRALEERRSAVVTGEREALVEFLPPGIRLLVFGAGGDARPLASMAHQLGWSLTVVDDRPAYALPEHFPAGTRILPLRADQLQGGGVELDGRTPALVMTHHFLHDLDILQYLLPSPAPYIGLLGPRQRAEKLLAELAGRGVVPTAAELARLHGPVGVDIGSETPEEIALSALAEIRAVLSGRDGGFLRERSGPLHEWPR
jgi:xanthine/CO dehydrogenase XdhC/CoxF family maturation factor